jgi:hypothetical protein
VLIHFRKSSDFREFLSKKLKACLYSRKSEDLPACSGTSYACAEHLRQLPFTVCVFFLSNLKLKTLSITPEKVKAGKFFRPLLFILFL